MPKRFRDTHIWKEDWHTALPLEYKTFWAFLNDECDHAGIWIPNWNYQEFAIGIEIDKDDFLTKINERNERVRVLKNGNWLLTGFFPFQYKTSFVSTNKAVYSAYTVLIENEVGLDELIPPVTIQYPPKKEGAG